MDMVLRKLKIIFLEIIHMKPRKQFLWGHTTVEKTELLLEIEQ